MPTSKSDQWWVADFSYVWTLAGFCYVALLTGVYSRRILGWRVSTSKGTPLLLSVLEQALFTPQTSECRIHRHRTGPSLRCWVAIHVSGVHEALREAGIAGSIGTVGDALDNALMESTIGLFKTELVERHPPLLERTGRVRARDRGVGALVQPRPTALRARTRPAAEFEQRYRDLNEAASTPEVA
ncbi:hypothetical protein GCM10010472_07380 [Pseudonocardia halophobica]|uniref:Integrase catalytic domain-containing protein n=1 Tax=Pseudonocardia halophobica TaxID=29401 RepID=A0A9W6L8H7_9PSEU|nr:hypothetical protein GCM10017577_58930 [Pseudonocardia halophobica]